jgi:predicted RNase H-like HicB family nuclease
MALEHIVEERTPGLLLHIPDLSNADVVSQLGDVPAEKLRWARKQMDLIFEPLTAAPSAAAFRLLRDRSVRNFVLLSATAYYIISGELIKALAESRLPTKALDELKRMFAADRVVFRHEGDREEAFFCLRELARTYPIALDVIKHRPPVGREGEYLRQAQQSTELLFWSQFHLGCLRFLIGHEKGVSSREVMCEILNGFRAVVPAYVAANQALRLIESEAAGIRETPAGAHSLAGLTVNVELDPSSGSYVSYVPLLENISTFGDSVDEALAHTKELIVGYVESNREYGYPMPLTESEIESLLSELKD